MIFSWITEWNDFWYIKINPLIFENWFFFHPYRCLLFFVEILEIIEENLGNTFERKFEAFNMKRLVNFCVMYKSMNKLGQILSKVSSEILN